MRPAARHTPSITRIKSLRTTTLSVQKTAPITTFAAPSPTPMKFGVVIFPGSNCDQDLIHVLRDVMKQEVVELWHKSHSLQGCDFILLPGGFSYGDYLRSGAIARFSPIMQEVIEFADRGGYVFALGTDGQVIRRIEGLNAPTEKAFEKE